MTAKRATQGRGQKGKATSARTVSIHDKQARAVELNALGYTFARIAAELGYADPSSARKAVLAVMARTDSASAEELRAAHQERIRMAYEQIGPIMQGELVLPELPADWDSEFVGRVAERIRADRDLRLKAADRWNRTMEREAKLHGLDAPARQDITSDGGSISVVFNEALAPKAPE